MRMACFGRPLAGLASCICSPSGQNKENHVVKTESRRPSPLDDLPDIRRTDLVTQRDLPVALCYKLGGELGKGGYGQVIAAKSKKKQAWDNCALKSIPTEIYEVDCKHETIIAWKLVHPFIAQVYEVFQDSSHVRIIMEACEGGSLFEMVKASSPKRLHEAQVAKYVWQMLSGIAYMHHHGFAHRDVKPHNYLLQTTRDDSPLKLIDMGFACPIQAGILLTQRVGTVECSAPEVVRGSYDKKCDIWSIGVVTFFCCVAYCPFVGNTAVECLRKVVRDPPNFKSRDWSSASAQMRSIVEDMLTKDPLARPALRELAINYEGFLLRPDIVAASSSTRSDTRAPSKETLPEACCSQDTQEGLKRVDSMSSISSATARLFRQCTHLSKSTKSSLAKTESQEPSADELSKSSKNFWAGDMFKQARKGAQKISGRISRRNKYSTAPS